jgi:hypothetical protein
MAIDATRLRRGVRKLGEPPTDSNPELSEPTTVHTSSSGAAPTAVPASIVIAAGPLTETAPPAAVPPPSQAEIPPKQIEPAQSTAPPPMGIGAGRYVDGRSRRRTGRIEQINVKVSSQFNAELRELADRENILIVEALERALNAYLKLAAVAEASGHTVEQVLDNIKRAST